VDVPCGTCTGCCTSSHFIHIRPEERESLSRIPEELLFPAPFLPKGNVLMGYDENGHCPMLVEGKCSIYEHRPLTCRNYDCRIFAAAGIAPATSDDGPIQERVRAWKFAFPTEADRLEQASVQACAKFVLEKAKSFPKGNAPTHPSQVALVAVKAHEVFLEGNDKFRQAGKRTEKEIARAVVAADKAFS